MYWKPHWLPCSIPLYLFNSISVLKNSETLICLAFLKTLSSTTFMFTINPNQLNAKKARFVQAEKVKKSIHYLINECQNKLSISDEKLAHSLLKLQDIERLTPEIHYYHHALQAAMRRQEKDNVHILLLKLIDIIDHAASLEFKELSITSVGNLEWEKFVTEEAIRLTKEDCDREAEITPISESTLSFFKDVVTAALCIIARHDSDMYDEIHEQVKIIKLFDGKVTMGLTDVRILGAMLIRLPRQNLNPVLYFLEHIVHEASHIHLNCLMAMDPIILNSSEDRFASPLRKDLRPMVGVLHATYVSARIVRTFLQIYLATNNQEFLHPLAETLDEVIRGMVEIKKHAKLTEAGGQLIASIQTLIESAKTLPEWQQYNFKAPRMHRFGAGTTKVNQLEQAIA